MYPSPGRNVPLSRLESSQPQVGDWQLAASTGKLSHLASCTLTGAAGWVMAMAHHILLNKMAHSMDICDKTYMCGHT